jgi:DNA repair exonuclease SbcCD nuclease subunit
MKSLRFLHSADWHADSDPKKQAKLEASLKQMVEYCSNVKVNAIIHAGDVWERGQKYQLNSGVPIVLKYLHQLAKLVDFIFITKGNNSHDEPGSINLLHQIEPNVYAYEYPVVLHVPEDRGFGVIDLLRQDKLGIDVTDYIVTLVPYPTKASLLIEDSIDNNNANFLEKFEQVFEHIGNVTLNYNCPKLLAFHGNVQGSRLSTGQTLVSQDIMVAPSTLERALHDYYALGHIHLRQFFKDNMGYSGSIYNKSWGETEQKSFEVIEVDYTYGVSDDEFGLVLNQVMLTSARPMVTVEAEFVNGSFVMLNDIKGLSSGTKESFEVRFRCNVKENERNLITEDKIQTLKNNFGEGIKIEFSIVPVERTARSENIMSSRNLIDEVIEYAKVIDHKIDNGVTTKVAGILEDTCSQLK